MMKVLNYFRNICRKLAGLFLVFIAIFNFIFGLLLLNSIISKYEKTNNLSQNIQLDNTHQTTMIQRKFKIDYQYYFRIDYIIRDDICVPIYMFNTTKNILSIQNLTNVKLKSLLSKDLSIIMDIISLNTIFEKSEKISNKKNGCNYVLKLYIGLSYPASCDKQCQLEQQTYLTCQTQRLNSSCRFKFYSAESIILFNIHQIALMESSKYHEKSVYIRSYYSNTYWLESILDGDSSRLSITVSNQSRSLFLIKDGMYTNFEEKKLSIRRDKNESISDDLDKNPIEIMNNLNKTNCLSTFISFLSTNISNSYVKSQNERIILKNLLQTNQMKQESTFILISSKTNKDMVAFRALNMKHTYIAVNPITSKDLILTQTNDTYSNIDLFEKHFLFKFVYDQEEKQ